MKKWLGLSIGIVLTVALAVTTVPASADLEAYWPMNEGSGTFVEDVTS